MDDEEVLAFRSPLGARIRAALWAGQLGCGVGWALSGLYLRAVEAGLVEHPNRDPTPIILIVSAGSLGIAVFRGFREPPRSYRHLAGRVVAALFFGLLATSVPFLVTLLETKLHASDRNVVMDFLLVGIAQASLADYVVRRAPRASNDVLKHRRLVAAMLLGVLGIALTSDRLRCWLGGGAGCAAVAQACSSNDRSCALEYGSLACDRGVAQGCALAMSLVRFDPVYADRAEALARQSCVLASARNDDCAFADNLALQKRCNNNDVVACRAYAEGLSSGNLRAVEWWNRACILGDADACSRR